MTAKIPIPPPIPPSHPGYRHWVRESAKIPLLFYVDVLAALLVVLAFGFLVGRFEGRRVDVFILFFWLLATAACAVRMVRRLLAARRKKGEAPSAALAAFAVALVLPVLGIAALWWRSARELAPEKRQAEARQALTAIAEAERNFAAEMGGRFTLNFRDLGYVPAEQNRFYAVGFPSACVVKAGVAEEKARGPGGTAIWTQLRKREVEEFFRHGVRPEDCRDPAEGFEAYAVGIITEGGPLDIWMIDETGKLRNRQRGL